MVSAAKRDKDRTPALPSESGRPQTAAVPAPLDARARADQLWLTTHGEGSPTLQYADRIRAKLTEALTPLALDVIDESHKHAGHAGSDPRGETHFRVTVVSEQFAGKSRVDRQRLVYGLLAAELSERVHALALRTITPAENGGSAL